MIENAVKVAEKYAFQKLKIDWDIDILVTNRIPMIIPENGATSKKIEDAFADKYAEFKIVL